MDPSHGWFSQSGFMPHGHCYLWKPSLVWTHVSSDFLIGLAYLAISILLYRLVKKIRLPFSSMFLAFGAFIGFCGMTHFMEVWTLWNPHYWVSGWVKAVTAIASVATGIFLIPVRPKVEALVEAAQLSEQRKSELENAHRKLEIMYEQVREADQLKTQFFANVSHELRTPLALIVGPVEHLLASSRLQPEDRQSVEVIARNSKTLLKQVNDLLDISKLEAGRLKPKYVQVDLVKLIRVTVAHFETIMQSKNIFFSIQTPDSLMAEVDPDKMQRVFMNLISNAIKFTPDGGRIRISVETPNGSVCVSVSDTGPGVKEGLQDVIFERFRQGEEGTDRRFGGTGLGLAIVKDFVQLHGGSVRLLKGHTPGATFVVEFPKKAPAGVIVQPAVEVFEVNDLMIEGSVEQLRMEQIRKVRDSEIEMQSGKGKPIVLVCEDNPDMNQFVVQTLVSDFNVMTSADGREGLAKARARQPDLVVSDVMMPNMGGDQLLQEIRNDEKLRDLPVLLLSARTDDELRVKLLQEGASDYVVKPFQPEELRARARNLLTIKKTKEVLSRELSTQSQDLVGMAEEMALRRREAQSAQETAEIAKIQAEKASQARSMFLSLVSHELNTPLASQYLTLQTLISREAQNLTDKQRKMLNRLMTVSTQLKSLVESLLEYTRVESGRLPLSPQSIHLSSLLAEVIEEGGTIASKKGLVLRQESSMLGVSALVSDPKLVKIVLNNLVINALKFTQKGEVVMSAHPEPNGTVISVRDTGAGISPHDLKKIFDPFVQLQPLAQKSISGIGLGLALVKQIVTALGGSIQVESELGKGSTFTLRLPHLPPSAADQEA